MTDAPGRRGRVALALALALGLVLVLAGAFAVWWFEPFRPGLADCDEGAGSGAGTRRLPTSDSTWPRDCEQIAARLAGLGIPTVDPEVEQQHQHAHLSIEIEGEQVEVAAGVGIGADARPVSPLHTHTPDGLLHVESPVVRPYTLKEFMGVWGVRLTDECLAGYCTGPQGRLVVYVDGERWSRPLQQLVLQDKQSIAVRFGTAADVSADTVRPVDWDRWDV